MEQKLSSHTRLKDLAIEQVKNEKAAMLLILNKLELSLERAISVLRDIKLKVDQNGSYYIEDDSALMEDISKALSDE